MKKKLWFGAVIVAIATLGVFSAYAQKLDASSSPKTAKDYLKAVEAINRGEPIEKTTVNDTSSATPAQSQPQTQSPEKVPAPATGSKPTNPQAKNAAQPQKPVEAKVVDGKLKLENMPDIKTKDGSKRGNAAFLRVPQGNEKTDRNDDDALIFLYYDNFKINRSLSGGIGCDVKFAVMTNLDQRLSNLSIKLKWPGITTSLSFENVNPNIETYYNYALFGDGCYTMDKIPNIVVNRCRVKGMSQEACAAKIRWLSRK